MTNDNSVFLLCKYPVAFLALLWEWGFLIGVLFSTVNWNSCSAFMRLVPKTELHFFYQILILCIPYMLAFFLILVGKARYCACILFLKGISHGFCIYGFAIVFSSASWLIGLLCLFPSLFMLLPLFSVCKSAYVYDHPSEKRSLTYFLFSSLFLSIVNSFAVSPFLQMLIDRF